MLNTNFATSKLLLAEAGKLSNSYGSPDFECRDNVIIPLQKINDVKNVLESFSQTPNLKRVCIRHAPTTSLAFDEITALFEGLGSLPNLQTLQIQCLAGASMYYPGLATALNVLPNLVQLDITCDNIRDRNDGLQSFTESLKDHISLKEFKLSFSDVITGSSTLDSIAEALGKCPVVEKIQFHVKPNLTSFTNDFVCIPINDESVERLCQNPNVKVLKLGGIKLDEEHVNLMTKALKGNKSLKELRLWNCGISTESATQLAHLLEVNTGLEHLDLSRNQIGESGCIAIADSLQKNTTLHGLYLHCIEGVTERSSQALEQMLECNYTLTTIWANITRGNAFDKVQFYLKLNKAGKRHMLQKDDATQDEWVRTFVSHQGDLSALFFYISMNPVLFNH